MGEVVSLEENRKQVIIEDIMNRNQVIHFRPEQKYPQLKNQSRCDFIVEIYNQKNQLSKVVFIELKGTDFEKGIKQLKNTIERLRSVYNNCAKCCIYVGRNIPSIKSNLQRYKEEFIKEYGVKLVTKTRKCTVKFPSLLNCKCGCSG